jgi:hypothetical protein
MLIELKPYDDCHNLFADIFMLLYLYPNQKVLYIIYSIL